MGISKEVLVLSESQINRAFEERNVHMLEKEIIFIINNFAFNLMEIYSDILRSVRPAQVQIETEPKAIFKERLLASLKEMLHLSERIFQESPDFNEVKLTFDSLLFEVTTKGFIIYDYNPDFLLSITDAAEELGVSRQTVYKYIERGLEAVGEKGSQKIPKSSLKAWKNWRFKHQMESLHEKNKLRNMSLEDRLKIVNEWIDEFERKFRGTFYQLFGNLSDFEIADMPDADDILKWKGIEEYKHTVLSQFS